MADGITFDINLDYTIGFLSDDLRKVLTDEETMVEIYKIYAKLMEPYVPANTGSMYEGAQITAEGVTYPGPYAHYQYEGIVYGPNLPGWESYDTPGWRGPSGNGSKHPTGREMGSEGHAVLKPVWVLNANGEYVKPSTDAESIEWDFGYNRTVHPLATHHWDQAMMEVNGDEFTQAVKDILIRRFNELYG